MLSLYIASTEQKAGKTFISTGLATTMQSLDYSTCVYKPVQTAGIEINGFMQSPDLTYVKTIDPYIETYFTYLFKSDCEPLIAAEKEKEYIDVELIAREYKEILERYDCSILDGSNGLMSPLAPGVTTLDMLKLLRVPMLLVISPSAEAINNALMMINLATEKGVEVRGAVINNIPVYSDSVKLTSIPRIVEEYSDAKILGLVNRIEDKFNPNELITSILNGIDIESVFNVKIAKLDLGS